MAQDSNHISQIESVSGLHEALDCLDERSLHQLLEIWRQSEFLKIGDLSPEQLTELQARVRLLTEMETILKQIKSTYSK